MALPPTCRRMNRAFADVITKVGCRKEVGANAPLLSWLRQHESVSQADGLLNSAIDEHHLLISTTSIHTNRANKRSYPC